eukprot:PITA_32489
MAIGLRVENRLAGVENFGPWKARIMLLLEEDEVWDVVEATVQAPTDRAQLVEFNKKNVKAKRSLRDAIKDHLFPHVSGMRYTYQMWESLASLHQSSNENRKMVLRQKLRNNKMTKTDSVTSFLTRVLQVKAEMVAIGEAVPEEQLEEIRRSAKGANKSGGGCEEENVALAAKGKKGKKVKTECYSGAKQEKGKQKAKEDMSKVKCFACGKMGHCVVQCPNKKGKMKQGVAASVDVDDFATIFDSECALVASLATHVTSSHAWFIDSGASYNMTGDREHFTSLLEDDVDLEVVHGDNSKVKATGMGTVSF